MRRKIGHDAVHYMYIVAVSMVGLTVLSFVGLRSAVVLAEPLVVSGGSPQTASATATVNVAAACSMTTDVSSAHSATIANGTYYDGEGHNGIGLTTLKTTCNDASGYAIYAVGYTGEVIGGANSTKLVGVKNSNNTIVTGTSQSGPDSNWAMRIGTTGSSYVATVVSPYDDFAAVPSSYAKVAYYNSNTDTGAGATGSSVTATYAAYISGTQAADTYNGKVRYTMVHPADEVPLQPQNTDPGKICYYPNGSNVVGSMGCQTVSTSATDATLLASNFSREGYGFAGWSTTFDYSDSTGFYGPQEYITFTAGQYTGSNPGLSLYARWIKSAGNLQGWTGCSSLASGAVTALTDQRDNDTYAVAKLADGNCWMIENLRLDNTNSDNSTGALSQGYAAGFAGLADSESPWAYNSTTANSLYSTDGSTAVTISGSSPYDRMPRYNNVNTPSNASDRPSDPTSNSATNSTTNAGMYSYGNYYTWTAASTDTSTTSRGDYNTKSICPTGWSIPRGGDKSREATNDFWTYIVTNLNSGTNPANYDSESEPYYAGSTEGTPVSNALRAYPNNFVYSGDIGSSSVLNRGSDGLFWSSTAYYSSGGAYYLYFDSSNVSPGTVSNYKSYGRSVRCLTPGT